MAKPVNDNCPGLEEAPASFYDLGNLGHRVGNAGNEALEGIVTASVLVTTAFRLRDEHGLILGLRRLSDAVNVFETDNAA